MDSQKHDVLKWIAAQTGPPMFCLSLTFLVCLACVVVPWSTLQATSLIDTGDAATISELLASPAFNGGLQRIALVLMAVIWPLIILEAVFHWCTRPWDKQTRKFQWFSFLFCLCPALRMCARSPEMNDRLWLPGLGWRRVGKRLRRRLERIFSVPMIVIAVLILPILIVEFFMKAQVEQYDWLRIGLLIGTGVIWFAFAAEFVLMVSVTDKKLAYCKKHWVDLAIILLPFISFLRSLRIMRATRVARVMMIPQLGKAARMYRLRGTVIKAIQALILLEFFQRLFGSNPERSIGRLRSRLSELEEESREIKRRIVKLERKQAEMQAQQDEPSVAEGAPAAKAGSVD